MNTPWYCNKSLCGIHRCTYVMHCLDRYSYIHIKNEKQMLQLHVSIGAIASHTSNSNSCNTVVSCAKLQYQPTQVDMQAPVLHMLHMTFATSIIHP